MRHHAPVNWTGRYARIAGGLFVVLGTTIVSTALAAPLSGQSQATPTATTTLYAPFVVGPTTLQFTAVVYDGRGDEAFEHIHFCNNGNQAVSVAGWKIVSETTGKAYTFGAGVSIPANSCSEEDERTLNTSYAANADNVQIFNWALPKGTSAWPNDQGKALLLNANDFPITFCSYVTDPDVDEGEAECGAE